MYIRIYKYEYTKEYINIYIYIYIYIRMKKISLAAFPCSQAPEHWSQDGGGVGTPRVSGTLGRGTSAARTCCYQPCSYIFILLYIYIYMYSFTHIVSNVYMII